MSLRPQEIYDRACELGLRLEPKGDKLAVSPADRIPADFAATLREHKGELMAWLNSPPCPGWRAVPPSGLPLDPCRPNLSGRDARRLMSFVVRQINGADSLCGWCLKREMAYWQKFRWSDSECALAAARDAACYQLKRNQAEVLATLAAFDDLTTATAKSNNQTKGTK